MKQCEKCGQMIDDGAAFCTNCGAAVSSESTAPVSAGMGQPMGPAMPVTNSIATNNQPMGPAMSSAVPPEEPKKKIDGKTIALIAVSAVCLIIGIVGIILAIVNSNNNNRISSNGDQVATGGSGGGTVDVVSSGTKVSYAGYEFIIPDGYEYEIAANDDSEEALVTSNSSDEYAAAILYDNSVSFTQIENNMDAVANSFGSENGISVAASVENVDGVKFVCFDLGTMSDVNVMYAFSEADLYYFQTTIITNPGVSGKQYLSNVAKVVGSAQKKKSMNKGLNGNALEGIKIQKPTI